jgi:hypothetical protein
MVRKARLADGTRTGMRIVTADTVECVVAAVESEWDGRVLDLPGTRRSAWRVLRAGILRSLAGVRSREIALRAQCAESTAFADVRAHQSALQASQIYADVAAECVVRALAADWRRRDTGR